MRAPKPLAAKMNRSWPAFLKARAFSRCSNQWKRPSCDVRLARSNEGRIHSAASQHGTAAFLPDTQGAEKGGQGTNRGEGCKVSSRDLGGLQSDLLRE
jgi:hypothetical protein